MNLYKSMKHITAFPCFESSALRKEVLLICFLFSAYGTVRTCNAFLGKAFHWHREHENITLPVIFLISEERESKGL